MDVTCHSKRGFTCSVITISRPQAYVHDLVASIALEGPLNLFVGSTDAGYLSRYAHRPSIRILGPSEEEWKRVSRYSVHRKAAWNYCRALTHSPRAEGSRGILVLEDDVLLARGWYSRLLGILRLLEAHDGDRYVLALYSVSHLAFEPDNPDLYYVRYPVWMFYGTQGMFYPDAVRFPLADYLRRYGVDRYLMPYDLLVRTYLAANSIPLYAANPCLVQHMGEAGTGLGSFHRTDYFRDAV